MEYFKKYKIIDYDFALMAMVISLTSIGIMAISSADPASQKKQIAGMAIGIFAMIFISLLDYQKLIKYLNDSTRETFLKYLRGWYKSHYHSAWYDTHKNEKFKLYYGYWCFEAGAIAKRLGLDDKDLQNEQYYPYDMVHYIK